MQEGSMFLYACDVLFVLALLESTKRNRKWYFLIILHMADVEQTLLQFVRFLYMFQVSEFGCECSCETFKVTTKQYAPHTYIPSLKSFSYIYIYIYICDVLHAYVTNNIV
jgi:hypothetical protein